MLFRTLLFAVVIATFVSACSIGDDEDPSMPTPAPTVPITGAQATATPTVSDEAAATTSSVTPDQPTLPSATELPIIVPTSTPTLAQAGIPTPTVTPLPSSPPTPTPAPVAVPLDQLTIGLELVADGLIQPDGVAHAGDGSNRVFVLEQPGRIRIVNDGGLLDMPFLDIVDRVGSDATERGLLGLAFHPDYAANGRFFVNYTNRDGNTVISEFAVTGNSDVADPSSEKLILFVEQPASNHNGGNLAFGPDGFLWIALGDGGGAGDRFGNAQNPGTLLGSMLRIDIDGADPYGVPESNPFINSPDARNETWAIGLRNPWRYSFDRLTGDLYIADVGQGGSEEINFASVASTGGENYGWPIIEGSFCYESGSCNVEGLVKPIAEYDHAGGNCAVTGGFVYRGTQSPGLWGAYVYADYCSGRFWGLRRNEAGVENQLFFQRGGAFFASFGEDEQGEIYVVSQNTGALYRIVAF